MGNFIMYYILHLNVTQSNNFQRSSKNTIGIEQVFSINSVGKTGNSHANYGIGLLSYTIHKS